MDFYRPGGVIAFTILFLFIGLLEFLVGIRSLADLGLEYYGRVVYWTSLSYFWSTQPKGYAYLFLAFGNFAIDMSFSNLMPFVVSVLLIGSVIYFTTSACLFSMKKWGHRLSMLAGILNMVCGALVLILLFPTLLSIAGIFIVLFGIIILWYFLGDVRYEFE
ncbi:MAG: hypothetical protein QXV37_00270 [Candidatus Jordarchaeaceae archaeon]